jgi:hypothetical protein
MLAGAPSPRGSGATPESAGTLFEGSRTVRCLAALPRRVHLMGQTVCILPVQTITSSSFPGHSMCSTSRGDPRSE